jgi:hypothetical protein
MNISAWFFCKKVFYFLFTFYEAHKQSLNFGSWGKAAGFVSCWATAGKVYIFVLFSVRGLRPIYLV